jgi:hypothetical protein
VYYITTSRVNPPNLKLYLCPAITKIQRITPKRGLDNFSAKDRVARTLLPACRPANSPFYSAKLSSRAQPSDSQSESDGGVEGPAVSLDCHQCRRERPRVGTRNNLSSRAQSRDPVSLNLTPAKQPGAPSFRVLCGKVGTENLDQRTPSISETGQGQSLPKIELPTLEKAQGQASLPLSS